MIAASLLLITGAVTLLVMGLWQSSSVLLGASIAASVLAAVVLIVGARRLAAATAAVPTRRDAGHRDAGHRGLGYDGVDRPDLGYPDLGHEGYPEPGEDPGPRAHDRPAHDQSAPEFGPADDHTREFHRADPLPGHPTSDGHDPGRRYDTEPLRTGHSGPVGPVTTAIPAQQTPVHEAPGTDEDPDGDLDADPPDEPAPQQVSAADAARVGRMLTEVLVVDGRPRYHLPGCVHLLGRESEPLPVGEAIELGFTPCSLCEPDSALLADARRV